MNFERVTKLIMLVSMDFPIRWGIHGDRVIVSIRRSAETENADMPSIVDKMKDSGFDLLDITDFSWMFIAKKDW